MQRDGARHWISRHGEDLVEGDASQVPLAEVMSIGLTEIAQRRGVSRIKIASSEVIVTRGGIVRLFFRGEPGGHQLLNPRAQRCIMVRSREEFDICYIVHAEFL